MKRFLIASLLCISFVLPAHAGCMSGALIGGTAGHFVGHGHAVAGAAFGCAYGVHRRHVEERRAREYNQNRYSSPYAY